MSMRKRSNSNSGVKRITQGNRNIGAADDDDVVASGSGGRKKKKGADGEEKDRENYRYVKVPQFWGSERQNVKYNLDVQQQPKQSRMCGSGDKADRRPIDPPPIIRLSISHNGVSVPPPDSHLGIQSPYYFMFASLCTESHEELYLLATTKTRYVTGTTVSSLYHLSEPPNGDRAAYFVFPDIGVRVEGVYKFKMTMYEVLGDKVHYCAEIFTDKFYVYSAKRFPGMEPSTPMTKSLSHQGIRLRIRKPIRCVVTAHTSLLSCSS
ncbi:hypothetical protein BT69DRAFT_179790 [Atractiella rhizophila]|nr:hypothetical protein BT69DRAFT_179790 [Atractiella rhizophila]